MQRSYVKKLSAYSAMTTSAILLFGNKAEGQIMYTDIDPDTVITGGALYYIDLNNDGSNDFYINAGNNLWYNYIELDEFGAGSVMVTDVWSELPLALYAGDNISADQIWENTPPPLIMASVFDYYGIYGPGFGQWLDATDKYLGVRLHDGADYYYGWIRLSTSVEALPPHTVTTELKDYAIQLTPNTPLHAGDVDGCYTPIPTGTGAITSNSAKLKWGAVGGAEYYQVRYHAIIEPFWHNATIPAGKTFKKLNGLLCDMPYTWQVRAYCGDGTVTEYSDEQSFTTASCRMDGDDNEALADLYTYADQIHIDIYSDLSEASIFELYSIDGKLLLSKELTETSNIITTDVPNGLYIGRVYVHNTVVDKKLIIAR